MPLFMTALPTFTFNNTLEDVKTICQTLDNDTAEILLHIDDRTIFILKADNGILLCRPMRHKPQLEIEDVMPIPVDTLFTAFTTRMLDEDATEEEYNKQFAAVKATYTFKKLSNNVDYVN